MCRRAHVWGCATLLLSSSLSSLKKGKERSLINRARFDSISKQTAVAGVYTGQPLGENFDNSRRGSRISDLSFQRKEKNGRPINEWTRRDIDRGQWALANTGRQINKQTNRWRQEDNRIRVCMTSAAVLSWQLTAVHKFNLSEVLLSFMYCSWAQLWLQLLTRWGSENNNGKNNNRNTKFEQRASAGSRKV